MAIKCILQGQGKSSIELDATLAVSGKAADAGAVGEALKAISAENIGMTAATAEALGLEAGASVDDALSVVNEKAGNAFNIGDIKLSISDTQGEGWALCNGETVYPEDNPELFDYLKSIDSTKSNSSALWSNGATVSFFKYINGYYVVGGVRHYSSRSEAIFAYATNISGPWNTIKVWDGGTGAEFNDITFANGLWVAVGGSWTDYDEDGDVWTDYYARVAWSSEINGSWVSHSPWYKTDAEATILKTIYANGYWVHVGKDGSQMIAWYGTSPSRSAGNTVVWSSVSSMSVSALRYINNHWILAGCCVSSGKVISRISYTSDLSANWSTKDLWVSNGPPDWNFVSNMLKSFSYSDGHFVVSGTYYDGSTYYARLAYTTDITGTWAFLDLWSGASQKNVIWFVDYIGGYWVVSGAYDDGTISQARIAYAATLDSDWTTKDLWSDVYACAQYVTKSDGLWAAAGISYGTVNNTGRLWRWCSLDIFGSDVASSFASPNSTAVGIFDGIAGLIVSGGVVGIPFTDAGLAYMSNYSVMLPALSNDGYYYFIKTK